MDTETGKNNGTFQGKTYFKCEDGRGLFISPAGVASESLLMAVSQALSDFTKENTGKITLESFKTIIMKSTGFMDILSKDILPKELSDIS